jgi:hypothetical protein
MKFILIISITVFTMSACNAPKYVYSPSTINAAFFTEKNQSRVGVSYVSHGSETFTQNDFVRRGRASGYDAQGAFALTRKWLIHGSYAYRKENLSSENNSTARYASIDYKRNFFDGGVGYFTDMTNDSTFYFQALAGYGYGKSAFTDFDNSPQAPINRFHNNTVSKLFLQGSFQYKTKNIQIQLPNRFTVVKFTNVETNYSEQELSDNSLSGLKGHSLLLYEPALNIGFRFNKLPALSFETQFGASLQLNANYEFYRRRTSFASIGVFADVKKLFVRSQ